MITDALDGRLLSAANFVRAGAVFADIGTDHAYLPIFLLKSGRIKRAVCSDINEGPLSSAMANVKENGLSELCDFILTDGAALLSDYGITDCAICGMGGELIARIIDRAPFLKDEGVRIILQPMSKQEYLREYLISSGFSILDERYSYSCGKYYVCILAEYRKEPTSKDESIIELGPDLAHTEDRVEYLGYLDGKLRACMRVIEGKTRGAESADAERMTARLIEERIKKLKE